MVETRTVSSLDSLAVGGVVFLYHHRFVCLTCRKVGALVYDARIPVADLLCPWCERVIHPGPRDAI